jgi:hypothetical protein
VVLIVFIILIRLPTPKEFAKMNREELASFRAKFKPYLEEMKENILEVFRTFPKCMLLVCRLAQRKIKLFNFVTMLV